jgi:hypothetical protein
MIQPSGLDVLSSAVTMADAPSWILEDGVGERVTSKEMAHEHLPQSKSK